MNTTRARFAAATLLTVRWDDRGCRRDGDRPGASVRRVGPGRRSSDDAQLVDDLAALLPFIGAFVAVDLATARGLAQGRAWAVASASVLSLGTVAMGALGLLLVVVGSAPAVVADASRGPAEAIGLIAGFAGVYLTALLALRADGLPSIRPGIATT